MHQEFTLYHVQTQKYRFRSLLKVCVLDIDITIYIYGVYTTYPLRVL
jgi:hypothetical protein